jgi:hypothetical protein
MSPLLIILILLLLFGGGGGYYAYGATGGLSIGGIILGPWVRVPQGAPVFPRID